MSVQSPPVTVITLPTDLVTSTSTSAPSTTTTVTTTPTTTTPTTTTPSTEVTATTVVAPSPPTTLTAEVEPAGGLVILVFLGVAAVVGMAMIVWKVVRRWSSTRAAARAEASPVVPAGVLAERVRQIAARATVEETEPESAGIDAIALADLYPWAGNSEELTLVVDLTTAETLHIDSNTMTTAAQTILTRRSGPDHR